MEEMKYMTIDGQKIAIEGEKNVLEVARKAHIDIPAFCYDPELSIYGACRMCVVETERGMDAACTLQPYDGMIVKTNTPRLRKYRKMILELLLANHCRECTTCEKSGSCKLQEFANRYGLEGVRFPNTNPEPKLDKSSLSLTRDAAKCILCGKCVRMCNEVQNVGAIDYGFRGSKMKIVTAFDGELASSPCVGCGQCAAVCPTGAIIVKNDTEKVWKALADEGTEVSVQVAPAVRVALSKEFGLESGEPMMGKLISALKALGFDKVYDTSIGADICVIEEGNELIDRIKNGGKFPMFTSCCPAWIRYVETRHPEYIENVSSCKSPMEMLAAVVKKEYSGEKKSFHVAVMPCTAKKFEGARDEFGDVDVVLTTQEIIRMIKSAGIDFTTLQEGECDNPFGESTGAGVIFGVTVGVTNAALRYVASEMSDKFLSGMAYTPVEGFKGVSETSLDLGNGKILHIAVVSGLANTEQLIKAMQEGKVSYDFVEVMSCPGGCINGGGQPQSDLKDRAMKTIGLKKADKESSCRLSQCNETVKNILSSLTKEEEHHLFHIRYGK